MGEEIARGGMGVVCHATDTMLDRVIAVKILQDKFGTDTAAARRFLSEARITARLQHPAIPPVHDLGTLSDGRPFLVMKLIQGDTLDRLLKNRPSPAHDWGRFITVFAQICQAVAYAHARKVIHRDLKPANVMVGAFGEVQVMDWGLAKVLDGTADSAMAKDAEGWTAAPDADSLTRAGSVMGTLAYMPPEQAAGDVERMDERSDVFGLGAVLCEILTGSPPYTVAARVQSLAGDTTEAFERLDRSGADPELVMLCKRCLATERGERPADAGELAAAVGAHLAASEERARRAELERVRTEAESREQTKRRKLQLAIGFLAAALVVLGMAGWRWRERERETREREQRITEEQAERVADELVQTATSKFDLARGAGWNPAMWAEAREAARQAEATATRLPFRSRVHQRASALRGEIERLERNRRLVSTLLEIQASMGDTILGTGDQDFRGAHERYAEAFRDFGTDLFQLSPVEGADLLASMGAEVRVQLAAALDDWVYVQFMKNGIRMGPFVHLFEVTRRLDPDPLRNRIRELAAAADGQGLKTLVGGIDPAEQPTQTVNLVAVYVFFLNENSGGAELAADFLVRAHPHHPGDFQICHNLAWFYTYLRRYDAAIPYSVAAIAIRPHSMNAWWDYSRALSGASRYVEAEAACRRMLELQPGNLAAYLQLARLLGAKGDSEAAVQVLREAIEIHPKDPMLYNELRHMLYGRRDFVAAVEACRASIELAPNYYVFRFYLGDLFVELGDLDGAAAAYREALRIEPSIALVHSKLGSVLRAHGDLDGAVSGFQQALKLNSKDVAAQINLGNCLLDRMDYDAALTCYREAVQAAPNHAPAHFGLGCALRAKGDLDAAIDSFQEASRLAPTDNASAMALKDARRLRECFPHLPQFLAGTAQPASLEEATLLAELCGQPFVKQYAESARRYAELFSMAQGLADDLQTRARYRAACAALLAARGEGVQAPSDPGERAALRSRSIAWLRADLTALRKQANSNDAEQSQAAAEMLAQWLRDASLSDTRGDSEWIRASTTERREWDEFWADVKACLTAALRSAALRE
ncbi:MAG: tetratricopeptide repeat protein [Pirellulales bacterium]